MPLVDYRCKGCATTHEIFVGSPVPDSIECPSCGGAARRKFGLGGLLGVRPARRARERLDQERATQPKDHGPHDHHHHDHHQLHHEHDHQHGRDRPGPAKEDQP
jgi:putative FmdB family regulatory protein